MKLCGRTQTIAYDVRQAQRSKLLTTYRDSLADTHEIPKGVPATKRSKRLTTRWNRPAEHRLSHTLCVWHNDCSQAIETALPTQTESQRSACDKKIETAHDNVKDNHIARHITHMCMKQKGLSGAPHTQDPHNVPGTKRSKLPTTR